MTIAFVWKEQYAVGVPELDHQHRYLFDLGNEIQKADIKQARAYVMKLYQYATAHFTAEEQHMKQIKYPDVKAHRKLHDQFVSDLNAISDPFTPQSFDELKKFLYTWLIHHILNEDHKYFVFANRHKPAGNIRS